MYNNTFSGGWATGLLIQYVFPSTFPATFPSFICNNAMHAEVAKLPGNNTLWLYTDIWNNTFTACSMPTCHLCGKSDSLL